MNAKMISIALAIIATSTAAFAADPAAAGKTRAEVRAELEQAYAHGQLGQTKEYVDFTNVPSTKSRAQVRAELAQTQPGANTEYVEPPRIVSGKSRAEVRAELEQAYAQGELGRNTEYVEFTNVASTRSREEVREEAIRAAKAAREHADYSGR